MRLCQEYGIIDAAAFLLERAGDVGSALGLVMTGLRDKIDMLVAAVENKFSVTTSGFAAETDQFTSILKLTEVCESIFQSHGRINFLTWYYRVLGSNFMLCRLSLCMMC